MATVEITKWDIAKALGLQYLGEIEKNTVESGYQYAYNYTLNGNYLEVLHGMGDDEAIDESEAHEVASDLVLKAIGKLINLENTMNEVKGN